MSDRTSLHALGRQFADVFFIPKNIQEVLTPVRAAGQRAPAAEAEIAEAFCKNLQSIVSMTGLPYILAVTAAHLRRQELLRYSDKLTAALRESGDDAGATSAEQTRIDPDSVEYGDAVNWEACAFLLGLAKEAELRESVAQLHYQATVLIWGALEHASRDLFKVYLNRTPAAYVLLLQNPETKKRFDLPRISLEQVADFDFDLSSRLGDLLLRQNDLADLTAIKAAFLSLFANDATLREALSAPELWKLFQRRNLIVHRQGRVDERYRSATGDHQPLGAMLVLSPDDLTRYLKHVSSAVEHLLLAAAAPISQSNAERSSQL